jgi:Asp/Glu/hydantoin racemase
MGIPEIYREVWRRRLLQEAKGYTAAHDDDHADGSIADAAACYASPNAPLKLWPWRCAPPDQSDRRERLVDAAALCIAEIERMDRAGVEQDIIRTYDPTIPYVDKLRRT